MKNVFKYYVLALILVSCGKDFMEKPHEDFFYVKRLDARFPVWVKGNLSSENFLLIVHGGPGSTGTQYFRYGAFDYLEEDYAVVYWEQRASGFSQGTGAGGQQNLNAEEGSLDCDAVIEVIRHKYNPKNIFLLGHSWGGVLTTAYLANNAQRHNKIKGWILVNGGHNWELGQQLSVQWVRARAEQRSQDNTLKEKDRKFWSDVVKWYDENPLGNWDNINSMGWMRKHVDYVDKADGYFLPENRKRILDKIAGNTEMRLHEAFSFYGVWAWFTKGNPPIWESQRSITTEKMGNITLPSLILWGRHDGILPVELAQDAYDRISTPEADKSIIIFEQTAHSPMFEETYDFNKVVKNFIDTYK